MVGAVLRDADKYIAQIVMVQRTADKAFLPFAMMTDPGRMVVPGVEVDYNTSFEYCSVQSWENKVSHMSSRWLRCNLWAASSCLNVQIKLLRQRLLKIQVDQKYLLKSRLSFMALGMRIPAHVTCAQSRATPDWRRIT